MYLVRGCQLGAVAQLPSYPVGSCVSAVMSRGLDSALRPCATIAQTEARASLK